MCWHLFIILWEAVLTRLVHRFHHGDDVMIRVVDRNTQQRHCVWCQMVSLMFRWSLTEWHNKWINSKHTIMLHWKRVTTIVCITIRLTFVEVRSRRWHGEHVCVTRLRLVWSPCLHMSYKSVILTYHRIFRLEPAIQSFTSWQVEHAWLKPEVKLQLACVITVISTDRLASKFVWSRHGIVAFIKSSVSSLSN